MSVTRPRRQRVDWEQEIRKTERIRRRGLIISALSFAMAAAFIFGAGRITGTDIQLPRQVLSAVCLVLACAVFFAVLKRRARLKREHMQRMRDLKNVQDSIAENLTEQEQDTPR